MIRSTRTFLITLSVTLLFSTQIPIPSAAPTNPEPPLGEMVQRVYAPLGILGSWDDVKIAINNRSPEDMTVTPTLFMGGQSITGDPLVLRSAEVRWIPLEVLVPSGVKKRSPVDAVELTYFGHMMEVAAQAVAAQGDGRGSTDVLFSGDKDYRTGRLHAVWLDRPAVRAVVTLANASDASIRVTIDGSREADPVVELAPQATRTIVISSRRNDRRHSGAWIRLEGDGPIGSLRAAGFLEAPGRVIGTLRFFDSGNARGSELFGTGLRTGNTDVHLVLMNTGGASLTASARFLAADRRGVPLLDLPTVTLEPGEAATVETRDLTLLSRRLQIDRVSVQIRTEGAAGSLIGSLSAVDRATGLVHDVPLKDLGPIRQSTGSYPWRLDGDPLPILLPRYGTHGAFFGSTPKSSGWEQVLCSTSVCSETGRRPIGTAAPYPLMSSVASSVGALSPKIPPRGSSAGRK